MNANEIIANRANEILGAGKRGEYAKVNPNGRVSMAQSTNDVTPTASRLALFDLTKPVIAELEKLGETFAAKATQYATVVKPGRTHLQDAVPITFGQEFGGWAVRMRSGAARLEAARAELCELGIGGTAAGTGLNADPEFRARVCTLLAEWTGEPIVPAPHLFAAMPSSAAFVRVSSGMRTAAIELSSIANDIRLMASGRRTHFGEPILPPLP